MDKLREEIDIIDQKIEELFIERMRVVKQVAIFKKNHHLTVFDNEREKEIILKNKNRLAESDLIDYYLEIYKKFIEVSKKYQERVISSL